MLGVQKPRIFFNLHGTPIVDLRYVLRPKLENGYGRQGISNWRVICLPGSYASDGLKRVIDCAVQITESSNLVNPVSAYSVVVVVFVVVVVVKFVVITNSKIFSRKIGKVWKELKKW
jgi:hypothetical protein